MVWRRDFALVNGHDGTGGQRSVACAKVHSHRHSREEADSKTGHYAPDDHDPEAGGEGLDSASDSKDDSAEEEGAASANDVADAAGRNGGYCGARGYGQG